jgi:hypothetical protein
MDDPTMTHRWVATADSASRAAGAYAGLVARRPRLWVSMGVVGLAYGMLLALLGNHRGLADRVAWGVVFGAVSTAVLMCLVLALVYGRTLRQCRRQLRPGVVLESSFGPDAVHLRGPWVEARIQVAGLASVSRRGPWVFVKQRNSPVTSLWPGELFPADELARLRAGIAARTADPLV